MTENTQTDREQTEKPITEATLIPWMAGLSGPIRRWQRHTNRDKHTNTMTYRHTVKKNRNRHTKRHTKIDRDTETQLEKQTEIS